MINIETFKAVEMRIGTIQSAEKVEGADKLLKLMVDFGPKETPVTEEATATEERDVRQILSGIAEYYAPESLVGKQCPFVVNLEPRMLRGLESHGMILAVGIENGVALLHPDKEVSPGSNLR